MALGASREALVTDPKPGESSNRRNAVRFSSINLVNYTRDEREREVTPDEFRDALSGAETLDLSVGGCRLKTREPLPRDAEFTFDVMLDDHVLSVRGKVRRTKKVKDGYEVGVEFFPLEPFDRDGIKLFLMESGADED